MAIAEAKRFQELSAGESGACAKWRGPGARNGPRFICGNLCRAQPAGCQHHGEWRQAPWCGAGDCGRRPLPW